MKQTSYLRLSDKMMEVVQGKESNPFNGILHHKEGVDLMPSSSDLFDFEISLVTAMNREVKDISIFTGFVPVGAAIDISWQAASPFCCDFVS